MLSVLLYLAANSQGVTQEEFREQAQLCGVSLKYEPRGEEGYAATLSNDGQTFAVRSNLRKEQRDCMLKWAHERRIPFIILHAH